MKWAVICSLAAAVVAFTVFMLLRQEASEPESVSGESPMEDVSVSGNGAKVPAGSVRSTEPQSRRNSDKPVLDLGDDDEDDNRTPAEKALAERIDKALQDEDFKALVACAEEVQKCGDDDIRQSMVDALGWFGEKALPELTPFLADDDEDVRDSAMNEWTMALSSVDDEAVKIKTVELAMGVLKNEDALEDISGEYIGVDEKLAVESLARVIEGGGSKEGVEKAKETYELVTGDEWTDVSEAKRWIAEEYEPPEGS